MGRKRKFSSEDEYRLEKSRRDRERYIRKLVRHKKAALLAIEPQSAETQVLPMTTAPQATEHNLFYVPVHHDLPAKHAVGCFCLDLPVFSLPDNTDIPSTSTVSSIDPFCPAINDDSVSQSFFNSASSHVHVHQFPLPPHSASNSSINEGSNIATSSNLRPGNHRRRTNIPLIEQIQSEPSILPFVPDCIHCHAKRYYMEPPRFCCASGEIKLAPTKMPDRLVQLYKANTPESKEFRQCVRSYNNMFAFTSLGVHYDKDLSKRNDGIYTFRVQGQIYHFMNSLFPSDDDKASNLQLYFYDTEHELANRMAISGKFKESIVQQLRSILDENPYSAFIRSLTEVQDLDRYRIFLKSDSGLDQRVYNTPTVSQVAAIWSESDLNSTQSSRNIEISTKTGNKKIVKQYYGCYDALQYPLIYARGETGWHPGILRKTKADILERPDQTCSQENLLPLHQCTNMDHIIDAEEQAVKQKKKRRPTVSCREYYAYKFQIRNADQSNLLHISRLLQQYSVDTYVKLETSRLEFYRGRQNKLRTEAYQGLVDVVANGERNAANVGKRIILPASFIGGPRDMRRRYMDAMALVQRYGKPDIFLTMTCNPSWPEIKQHLDERDESQNRPDLIARVFRAKMEQLKEDLLKKNLFGQVATYTYVVEFQKRGLPHAHFLIILKDKWKMYSPEEYDRIVSAELPDKIKSPYLFSLVIKHMLHGPCGSLNVKSPCMRQNQKCKNNYPKDFSEFTKHGKNSYPLYRRRDDGNSVMIRDHKLDNRWVIPYNAYLLAKYDCHINVEICSAIEAVKYIYKYIYKGHDRVIYQLNAEAADKIVDEIKNFQSGRWICAPEAMWRIFAFDLSVINPAVIVLHLHLQDYQSMPFHEDRPLQDIIQDERLQRTMLTQFFVLNRTNKQAQDLNLLYKEFPQYFVWDEDDRIWYPRKCGQVIGRITTAHPIEGERYYLRMLLMHVRKPKSFTDLKTVNGFIACSFKKAAEIRGLLQIDNGAEQCLSEAALYKMPSSLRQLFAVILIYSPPSSPKDLWDKFYHSLSEDIANQSFLSEEQTRAKVLHLIDEHLQIMGKNITDFGFSQSIRTMSSAAITKEIEAEYAIPISEQDLAAVSVLNHGQRHAFHRIMEKVNTNVPAAFFIDGPGGTGKSFLYKALLATVRSRGDIALATATSGAAASLLAGGRTAHSRFKIPLQQEINSTCNISKQSAIGQLVQAARLIIWDEAAMAKKYAIESLDRLLRDLLNSDCIFGGKVLVFGGDFRQTLPVVRKGQREDYVSASLVNSYLWPHLQKIRLTENMRARYG